MYRQEREESIPMRSTMQDDELFVLYKGKKIDISSFVDDHPGGRDYLLQYAGQDVTAVMSDHNIHSHSRSAFQILESLDSSSSTISSAGRNVPSSTFEPSKSDLFVDFSKPVLKQIWSGNYSKAFYLEQIHLARHLSESARMFDHPLLEMLTRTVWWVVPLFWGPIVIALLLFSCLSTFHKLQIFLLGFATWTLVEYLFHRFVFHIDHLLPDNRLARLVHFTVHGIHHFMPMDRYRLVMPPLLMILLSLPVALFCLLLLTVDVFAAAAAGLYSGYISYDLFHYFLHHGDSSNSYLKSMKNYHVLHHYTDSNSRFGVTSQFWDIIFHTQPIKNKAQ